VLTLRITEPADLDRVAAMEASADTRQWLAETGLARHEQALCTGRGRALLRAALARTYQRHPGRRIWLDVKAGNQRARSLYEAEGFAVTRVLAGAVPEPDGQPASDLVVMEHSPGR
jgi:ribosomal protein S18 acetylase RimI-like enzyme